MWGQLAEACEVVCTKVDNATLRWAPRRRAKQLGEPLGCQAEGEAIDARPGEVSRLVVRAVVIFD